jgi:hypothetical protein
MVSSCNLTIPVNIFVLQLFPFLNYHAHASVHVGSDIRTIDKIQVSSSYVQPSSYHTLFDHSFKSFTMERKSAPKASSSSGKRKRTPGTGVKRPKKAKPEKASVKKQRIGPSSSRSTKGSGREMKGSGNSVTTSTSQHCVFCGKVRSVQDISNNDCSRCGYATGPNDFGIGHHRSNGQTRPPRYTTQGKPLPL